MKTTKIISAVVSAAVVTSAISAGAVDIKSFSDELTIYLNGTNVYTNSENKPFIMNERTLVPLRPIFEAMGIAEENIKWYPDEKKATFRVGRIECAFVDDSSEAVVDSTDDYTEKMELDVPATIYNGNFYIPLRAFCNIWDLGIDWDDSTRSVYVTGDILSLVEAATTVSDATSPVSFANFIGEWGGIQGMHLAAHMDIEAKNISVNEANKTITLAYKYDMSPTGVWQGESVDYLNPVTVSYHEETVNVETGKTSYGTIETTEANAYVTDVIKVVDDSSFKLAIVSNESLYYTNAPSGFSYYASNRCTKLN